MVKRQGLHVATDYRLALLWLMDHLGSARMRDVLAAFERTFGRYIPAGHWEKDASGTIKWQHYVGWARLALVHSGLMGSGGRGLWTIEQAGRDWLGAHPQAGPADLEAEMRTSAKPDAPGFRWKGRWYAVTREDLLSRARELLAGDPPPEALRYRDWAVYIDERPINVKWLFALATEVTDYLSFQSTEARRALSQIGIDAEPLGERTSVMARTWFRQPAPTEAEVQPRAFYEQIAALVPRYLPENARHADVRIHPEGRYMQLFYAEFPGSHYELTLGRSSGRLAIDLQTAARLNQARLQIFEPHQADLSTQMGRPVVAKRWGSGWARVAVRLPGGNWTPEGADERARLIGRFVEATFPLLTDAFAAVPPGRKGRRAATEKPQIRAETRPHAILDAQTWQIRQFLQGRSARPTDEVLCEWVQFCYTFEMYPEGADLFDLIVPTAVNDWLYGRTRRLAQVCRLRAQAGGRQGESG